VELRNQPALAHFAAVFTAPPWARGFRLESEAQRPATAMPLIVTSMACDGAMSLWALPAHSHRAVALLLAWQPEPWPVAAPLASHNRPATGWLTAPILRSLLAYFWVWASPSA
jgi:hypothetical protein